MTENFSEPKDIRIGMKATPSQLKNVLNKYIILAYDHIGDKEGTIVFIGDQQDPEYDSWFMQDKPITPIYNRESDINLTCDE